MNWYQSIGGYIAGIFGGGATDRPLGSQVAVPYINNVTRAKQVNEDTALQISAVWSCAHVLTETVGSLPWRVYEVDTKDNSYNEVRDGWLFRLLAFKPNARQSSQEWRETMMLNLVLHGNAFSVIERNTRNEVINLWPLPSQRMNVELLEDGTILYEYHHTTGITVISEDNMLHVKAWGNGIIGLSTIAHAANAIGLAGAAEDFSASYFTNGGRPGGILTYDKILTSEQREQMRAKYQGMTEGSENAHKLMILEAGMIYQQIQISPNDMALIESRRFQIEDISRFFRVPLFLLNDTATSTVWGTGIDSMMLGFYKLTLKPYLKRFENAVMVQLLDPRQRLRYRTKLDVADLLEADAKTQAEVFNLKVQGAQMTPNEARAIQNLPAHPEGDILFMTSANTTIEKLAAPVPEPTPAVPATEPKPEAEGGDDE